MTAAVEPGRVAAIIRETAEAEILPRFRKITAADITPKGSHGDFATAADFAAEKALTERLTALLPGSRAAGEEGCEKHPELLDSIADDVFTWIIAPLDGTHNFAKGIPQFAVIVALARGGETVAAWIHDPLSNATVAAERGAGAWEDSRRPGVVKELDAIRRRFANIVNYRCAGHDYLGLARGRTHFALFSRLMPWDHAAGALIHGEAGGYNKCWDGHPYRPTRRGGGILLAPDAATWSAIAALVLAPL